MQYYSTIKNNAVEDYLLEICYEYVGFEKTNKKTPLHVNTYNASLYLYIFISVSLYLYIYVCEYIQLDKNVLRC